MAEDNKAVGGLQLIRDGDLAREIDEAIREATEAARATNKSATVNVKVKIRPKSHNQIIVRDDLKIVLPEPEKEDTTLFVTDNNELSRRDPRQPKLPTMGVVRNIAGGEQEK